MNKFDKLYDLIIEDIKNPKLRAHAKNEYRPVDWDEDDDEWRQLDGECGTVIRINKTYEKWLDNKVRKSYKKYDFDENQIYEPVLTEFGNNIKTKSYTGAELEDIKNEYKGTTVYELYLPMLKFINSKDKMKSIYEKQYEFKDLVTIDEENFYLDKEKAHRSGFAERKAFYIVYSQDDEDGDGGASLTMSSLENDDWLIKNSSTVEYYMQKDVEPFFEKHNSGKGIIRATVITKAGDDTKVELFKSKMIQLAEEIIKKTDKEKMDRVMSSPGRIKQYNATRTRWIQERNDKIQELKKEIEQLQKDIERISSELIK